jgi:hypothetical protein
MLVEVAQAVAPQPNKHKALSSNSSTVKNKIKQIFKPFLKPGASGSQL